MIHFLNWLLSLFCCGEEGCVQLTFGKHQVMVQTTCKPCHIWLNVCCDDQQVCVGDTTLAGATIVPGGFILVADVKANNCTIKWHNECCCCCE